jgi:dUTP pyrophosphatase
MQINFKVLHQNAKMPFRGSKHAAGYDLFCSSMRRAGDIIICGTGLAVEIPRGYFGGIYARSSIYLAGWEKVGGVTVVDSDYRGEVFVLFRDTYRQQPRTDKIRDYLMQSGQADKVEMLRPYAVGDRIAQLVLQPCSVLKFVQCEELSKTARGDGGYGSTGRQ